MKVLIAATPLTGHVNPLLAIGRLLLERGDEVTFITDPSFSRKVEAAGLAFVPYDDNGSASYLEPNLPPGPERWTHEFERRFIALMPMQAALLRELIAETSPDVIVAGSMFLGVLPLLLGDAPRPPIAVLNTSFLFLDRPDGAPIGIGLPPPRDEAEQAHSAGLKTIMDTAFVGPVRALADARLSSLGLPPLPASLTHSIVVLPDVFLQPSVPEFEYDYGELPKNLRFVGLLPSGPAKIPLPDWWSELDPAKPTVLVTQGTLANSDFGQLVEPALLALAERTDINVVATAGGRPVDEVHLALPANARISSYLPFDTVLSQVDLLVTNGGYGSVSQALAAGVPLVSAGLTEDKAEVAARIGWSGVGINLATNTPTVEALRDAIGRVLSEPGFKARASEFADAFRELDARREILSALDDLVAADRAIKPAAATEFRQEA
ncbi:glycosyltransferase [Methylobacterium brachythecii]|uniref:Glycosyl transferase n=1 Tax=Methylobacterium brachythecii TaxID=1176177 RepID=A0A7W6F912_9HYPH|nr:nucleotide disphospho-sugar-binding domain-containing protein [Methylobacterium brachythecii]MBB3905000.1 MGT family glycosyltransferase [Methylobacterium brachythecii]GLS45784.1 glycosyl transferase [Methylobacterium brachythecii]